jgi:hypothetical protein
MDWSKGLENSNVSYNNINKNTDSDKDNPWAIKSLPMVAKSTNVKWSTEITNLKTLNKMAKDQNKKLKNQLDESSPWSFDFNDQNMQNS